MKASKAAVTDAPKQSADMIGKLATDAAEAATRAETKIAEANRAAGMAANASMRKAADAARKSVEATRLAVQTSKDAAGSLGPFERERDTSGGIGRAGIHRQGRHSHRERRPRRPRGGQDDLGSRNGADAGRQLSAVGRRSSEIKTARKTGDVDDRDGTDLRGGRASA
ncbi:hypothetical protein ACU4GR_01235 [Methylobacterium oryzae CBMB20]